jgi:molybdate transport system substrate-binding protein
LLNKFLIVIVVISLSLNSLLANGKESVLIYCGITMVNPIKEMANILEKELDVKIYITQGGSNDLFNAIKTSNKGDIFIPGDSEYIKEYEKFGFYDNYIEYIGYNQAAIFVQKGNPMNVKGLDDFLRDDLYTMLCDYSTGSIGKMTKDILESYKGKVFFEDVYLNSVEVGTDSRNINSALRHKRVDLSINWKSTIIFENNKEFIDMVTIDEQYAPKMKIPAVLLKTSQNKIIAKQIIDFMAGIRGQSIMKKYGFID